MSDNGIYDLVYCGDYSSDPQVWDTIKEMIRSAFPDAILDDASDYLHMGRISVELENQGVEDYYLWLLSMGMHDISLCFNLSFELLRHGEELENKGVIAVRNAFQRIKYIRLDITESLSAGVL